MHYGIGHMAHNTPGQTPLPAIRSMSGRYASYWNAFLLLNMYMEPQSIQPLENACYLMIAVHRSSTSMTPPPSPPCRKTDAATVHCLEFHPLF